MLVKITEHDMLAHLFPATTHLHFKTDRKVGGRDEDNDTGVGHRNINLEMSGHRNKGSKDGIRLVNDNGESTCMHTLLQVGGPQLFGQAGSTYTKLDVGMEKA